MITVEYLLDDLPDGVGVDIKEDRGHLSFTVNQNLSLKEAIAGLNNAAASVLAGNHWFQEWKGDIITNAPEPGIPVQRDVTTTLDSTDPVI